MKRTKLALGMAALLAAGGASMALPAMAEDEAVYGRELMTEQERIEHRLDLRALKTEQEREAYRKEHHERMQERARERGKVLPAEPREYGQRRQDQGMGPRDGSGMGMGQGRSSGQR